MTAEQAQGRSYRVSIAGSLSAALRSAFPNFGATCSPSSTVFRVDLGSDQRSPDLAAMLQEHGLVLLSARRVPLRASED